MSNTNAASEIGAAINKDPVLTEAQLHGVVAAALKQCVRRKAREQVAAELRQLTGLNVTKRMLDDWASPSKLHLRVPAILIAPLGRVTGTPNLEMAVIGPGLRALVNEGARRLELRGVLVHLRRSVEAFVKAQRINKKGARRR